MPTIIHATVMPQKPRTRMLSITNKSLLVFVTYPQDTASSLSTHGPESVQDKHMRQKKTVLTHKSLNRHHSIIINFDLFCLFSSLFLFCLLHVNILTTSLRYIFEQFLHLNFRPSPKNQGRSVQICIGEFRYVKILIWSGCSGGWEFWIKIFRGTLSKW